MLQDVHVKNVAELNQKIREILSLEQQGRGDEICGTLRVYYSDDFVRQASHLRYLEDRGIAIEWRHEEA